MLVLLVLVVVVVVVGIPVIGSNKGVVQVPIEVTIT